MTFLLCHDMTHPPFKGVSVTSVTRKKKNTDTKRREETRKGLRTTNPGNGANHHFYRLSRRGAGGPKPVVSR
jgi:hypothetical protein